ncbi:hypothetical protein RF11_12094 [Thelohanellus kitauei]|uniref:Uncharacterized protein n=1 Tax=Thelohanellus kitauei TaxID=669202 RepID=A0A0C2MIY5_THEKT|nr:hypothetical protein RF11_12094 [Thelohanellus kitauei]
MDNHAADVEKYKKWSKKWGECIMKAQECKKDGKWEVLCVWALPHAREIQHLLMRMNAEISQLIQMMSKQIGVVGKEVRIANANASRADPEVNSETQNSSFERFNPAQELRKVYTDRFFTLVKANSFSVERMPHVFLSNQRRETFQLLKTAASQMSTAKKLNSLLCSNFSHRNFVVRYRNRFYTELKRKTGESVSESASRVRQKANTCDFASITDPLDEALKTGYICAVNHEAVLKAIFHKSTSDLTFSRIVDIAAKVE